jgi:hypothetical protein
MPDKKTEILNRIGETNKLSSEDATYIEKHYWDFKIPAFKRKKRENKKEINENELDKLIEHYQDYRIPMFVRRKKR